MSEYIVNNNTNNSNLYLLNNYTSKNYPFNLNIEKYEESNLLKFSLSNSNINNNNEIKYWLQIGLIWYYSFNHEESIVCFNRVLQLDPYNIMANWGISICNGQNYNTTNLLRNDFPNNSHAFQYSKLANELIDNKEFNYYLSELEIDLVKALKVRFNENNYYKENELIHENIELYEKELKKLYDKYYHIYNLDKNNLNNIHNLTNIICFYSESLMNYDPWKLWDFKIGKPKQNTILIKELIEFAFNIFPNNNKHIGLNHFYIHLMEMSPNPELTLNNAKILQYTIKDAGHLIHMPSHIYALCGKIFLLLLLLLIVVVNSCSI